MVTGLIAIGAALLTLALGLAGGRWLRLCRAFDVLDANWLLVTVAQGLLLLALLGGIEQRPLSRALFFATPMAFLLGVLVAVSPGGEPAGRWWQLWRWRFKPSTPER